jgi:hypothetical protein
MIKTGIVVHESDGENEFLIRFEGELNAETPQWVTIERFRGSCSLSEVLSRALEIAEERNGSGTHCYGIIPNTDVEFGKSWEIVGIKP